MLLFTCLLIVVGWGVGQLCFIASGRDPLIQFMPLLGIATNLVIGVPFALIVGGAA
jgi:hypothetical protein